MYHVKVEWFGEDGQPLMITGTIPDLPSPGKLFLVTSKNGKHNLEFEFGYVVEVEHLHHIYNILTEDNTYDLTILRYSGPMPQNVINIQALKNKERIENLKFELKRMKEFSDRLH